MKKFVLIAAVAALPACSQEAEGPFDTAAIETPAPAETVAIEQEPAGTYDLKRYNGGTSTIVITADGRYTDIGPNGLIDSGRFALKGGNYCFVSEGDKAEVCWTVGRPDADGSFTASDPEGHTVTLMRRAETSDPNAAETAKM